MAECWTNEQPNREGDGEKAAFHSVLATFAVQDDSAAKTLHSRGQPSRFIQFNFPHHLVLFLFLAIISLFWRNENRYH